MNHIKKFQERVSVPEMGGSVYLLYRITTLLLVLFYGWVD